MVGEALFLIDNAFFKEPSSPALKNLSPVPPNFEDSVTQPAFFSCYSSIGPSSDDSVILNSIAFPAVVKSDFLIIKVDADFCGPGIH